MRHVLLGPLSSCRLFFSAFFQVFFRFILLPWVWGCVYVWVFVCVCVCVCV